MKEQYTKIYFISTRSQHPFTKCNFKNTIICNSNNNHTASSNKSKEKYVRPLQKKVKHFT